MSTSTVPNGATTEHDQFDEASFAVTPAFGPLPPIFVPRRTDVVPAARPRPVLARAAQRLLSARPRRIQLGGIR